LIHIKVRRPTVDDRGELFEFFKTVVEDTFIKEGIEGLVGDLKEEIEFKRQYLENDLDSNGKLRYFLAAEDRGCIIGTIEYGPSSDLICTCTNGEYENLYELGTVFVRPDYQGQGIGNLLLNSMTQVLRDKGINQFCLDSGYSNAQKIWRKKFGEPDYFIKDYWGEDRHHLIWKINL
jgi:GNAT superfamily N-acetyltransferase